MNRNLLAVAALAVSLVVPSVATFAADPPAADHAATPAAADHAAKTKKKAKKKAGTHAEAPAADAAKK